MWRGDSLTSLNQDNSAIFGEKDVQRSYPGDYYLKLREKKFGLNLVLRVVLVIESKGLYFLSSLLLQWNSVNTETNGTCLSVRIIWVFRIKRALGKKQSRTLFQLS